MAPDASIAAFAIIYKISQMILPIQGGPKKTAQSLWHHNFAAEYHRVMQFSAKCFERNSSHD